MKMQEALLKTDIEYFCPKQVKMVRFPAGTKCVVDLARKTVFVNGITMFIQKDDEFIFYN